MKENERSQVDLAHTLHTMSQVEQGTGVLARAFQHDPLMNFLYPDSIRIPDSPARLYRATIRMGLLYGEVQTTPTLGRREMAFSVLRIGARDGTRAEWQGTWSNRWSSALGNGMCCMLA